MNISETRNLVRKRILTIVPLCVIHSDSMNNLATLDDIMPSRNKFVPDAVNCFEMGWIHWLLFQLLPELHDVIVNGPR